MTNRYYEITNEIRVHAVNDSCMNMFIEPRLLDEFIRILSKLAFPGCIFLEGGGGYLHNEEIYNSSFYLVYLCE